MNIIQQAAQFNDEGILQLTSAKYGEAKRNFELALVNLQTITNSHEFMQQLHFTAELPSSPNCAASGSISISKLQNDRLYIYNQALRFTHGTTFCRQHLAFYISTILFNLALAIHTESMNMNDEYCLRRALQMYDMSFEMADEIALDSDHAQKMMVLILNNKIHIHNELGAYSEQTEDLEILEDLISCLDSFCDKGSLLNNDIHREISLNRYMMNQTTAAPCV